MKERQRGEKMVTRIDPSHHEKAPPEGRCRPTAVDLTATMNDELRRPWVKKVKSASRENPRRGLYGSRTRNQLVMSMRDLRG